MGVSLQYISLCQRIMRSTSLKPLGAHQHTKVSLFLWLFCSTKLYLTLLHKSYYIKLQVSSARNKVFKKTPGFLIHYFQFVRNYPPPRAPYSAIQFIKVFRSKNIRRGKRVALCWIIEAIFAGVDHRRYLNEILSSVRRWTRSCKYFPLRPGR